MKHFIRFLMSRVVIVGTLILAQIALITLSLIFFSEYIAVYYTLSGLVGVIIVCKIINNRDNPSYKIAWIVLILVLPLFGVAMYYIFKGNRLSERIRRKMGERDHYTANCLPGDSNLLRDSITNGEEARQSDYILASSHCPPFTDTKVSYFPVGEAFFPVLLEKLRSAEKYIFLEYFIIDKGEMWDKVHEILVEKAAAGIDVRIIYDDMGCINHLDTGFNRFLGKEGIKCRVFNRFIPVLSARLNNRNHRKICAIDGKIAFTGGINIADEYINRTSRFGYWKDNAVMLEGAGAWSFTAMFLSMWDGLDVKNISKQMDYSVYKNTDLSKKPITEGIVQPYTDNPLDAHPVGQTIYLNMIYSAKEYIWITTPYLILDYSLEQALCTAAQSGVDVRIVVPGIPDKFFVNEATKSSYKTLLDFGVKLYEYTPGFIHAKTFVCDGQYATVGTVNLDFRSLFLHFECGVWLCGCPVIKEIIEDFKEIFKVSHAVTKEDCEVGFLRRIVRSVIELMAPLI